MNGNYESRVGDLASSEKSEGLPLGGDTDDLVGMM